MKNKLAGKGSLALLLLAFFIFGCVAAGPAANSCEGALCSTWQQMAFTAIIIMYFIDGLAYAFAVAFGSAKLMAFARNEFYYISFIAVLGGSLFVVDSLINNQYLLAFSGFSFLDPSNPDFTGRNICTGEQPDYSTWNSVQNHALLYVKCLRSKLSGYFATMLNTSALVGFISSLQIIVEPSGISGISVSPGTALKPFVETLGYALYGLSFVIAQLKIQEIALAFSNETMFKIFLPIGIVLSVFPFSRGAGGTLIALAVGFYLIFPLTYLVNEEITYEYCSRHNNCDVELGAVISGSARDIANDMLKQGGDKSARILQMLSYDGPLGPVLYIATFSAGIMPIFSLLVTLTLVRGLARIFGADVDFSTLIKII